MKRLAIVGYGRIAPKHVVVFRALGCQIVASCNRTPKSRERAETEGGIPRTYASIEAMLETERPDGVICCTSHDQAATAAAQVLPFDIPTLLEKPPGVSPAEFTGLKQLAAKHGTPVMVALNRRHYSVLNRAVADAGGPDAITAVFVDWSEKPEYLLNDRGFTRVQVAQSIYENTLHGLDMMAYLGGEIESPQVLGLNLGEPFRWMMSLQGVSRRGVLATFQSTWDSPGRWRLVFCSPKRRYQFAPLETCIVWEQDKKETRAIEPDEWDQRFKPGFYHQAVAFLDMIESRRVPALYGLESAAPAMKLAEALTRAVCPADITW